MEVKNTSRKKLNRPYFLDVIDQLPQSLLKQIRKGLLNDQIIEGIFVIPPETYTKGLSPHLNPLQALVFTQRGVLHLVASSKRTQSEDCVWISADDILMMKLSLILLYGKLEIFGVQNEEVIKIEVEYNTVAHKLLAQVLRRLIKKTWQKNPLNFADSLEDVTFSSLENVSFNFYNGLKVVAIQPGERILGHVYQPEIHEPRLKIFQKKIFPQMLMTLTDRQLILLQQDLKLRTHHERIFTFIPLYRIASIKQDPYKIWRKMSIQLLSESTQQPIGIILEPERAEKWQAIWVGASATGGI